MTPTNSVDMLLLVAECPEWRKMNEEMCSKPSTMQVIRIDLLNVCDCRVLNHEEGLYILSTKILGT